MDEQSQLFSIGPLMKAARKFKKFNQADVAQAIGCSQSALSKMEHNLLVPSAPQWFLFARFTSIPPETLETGIIDRHSKVKFNNDQVSLGFKIPKKYRHQRSEKVREIYPFLQYLEKKMTPPLNKEFMLSTGLEAEFFLDFDNLISFQLFIDTIQYFFSIGKNSPEEIKGIVDGWLKTSKPVVLDVEPIEDLQAIQPEEQKEVEPKTPTAEEPEDQEPQEAPQA